MMTDNELKTAAETNRRNAERLMAFCRHAEAFHACRVAGIAVRIEGAEQPGGKTDDGRAAMVAELTNAEMACATWARVLEDRVPHGTWREEQLQNLHAALFCLACRRWLYEGQRARVDVPDESPWWWRELARQFRAEADRLDPVAARDG